MARTGTASTQSQSNADVVRVLIADDDADIVESLKSVLAVENLPLDIRTAANEAQARQTAEREPIDIALLDIRLGKKNGLDLVPLLKQRNRHIQCIMMTGYPDIQYAVNAIRFGADDFLRKPINAEHLLSTLKRFIKYQGFLRERDQAQEWFRTIFETSKQMLFVTDAAGTVVQVNAGALAFCDAGRQSVVGQKIWSLSPWGDSDRASAAVRNAFNRGPGESRVATVEIQVATTAVDKSTIEFQVRPLSTGDSGSSHLLVEGRDITHELEKEKNLQRRAFHDDLTGLPNRTQLLSALAGFCSIGTRRNRQFSVLFIDLDNFKLVNDTHGHGTGDQVLQQTATRLKKSIRGEDLVARYSGDEFVAVLNEAGNPAHAQVVAERILRDMSATFETDEAEIDLSVSIGIANFPDNGSTAEELITSADEAMYAAKGGGKNRFKVSP